jgi:hypothetical protein
VADTNKNATSKQKKHVETSKSCFVFDLDYDLIEYFKKLKATISIYELLKFPYIQQKMLQSIDENNNKKNVALDKSVANFDKTSSTTTNKNQQPPNVEFL